MFSTSKTLKSEDPDLWAVIQQEHQRQEQHIELIASENYTSPAVMTAQGSQLTNKYAEGYPGRPAIRFDEKTDLVFNRRESLQFHANGMRFTAFDDESMELQRRTYYSVGGGFVVSDEVADDGSASATPWARSRPSMLPAWHCAAMVAIT